MKRGLLLVAALFMVAGTASGDLLHHWPLTEDGEDIVGDIELTIVGEIADGALRCADKAGAWGEGGNCFQTDSDGPWTLTFEIQTEQTNAWVMGRVQEGASDVGVNQGGKSFLLGFYGYALGAPVMDDSWNAFVAPEEGGAVNDGEWHHVGISQMGESNITFWVDGDLVGEGAFAGGLQDDGENEGVNDYFNIAGAEWMPAFEGGIRNVRYYDEAADQDLIDGSMGPPPPPPPGVTITSDGGSGVTIGDDVTLGRELTNIEGDVTQVWLKGDVEIEGETGAELVLLDVQLDDSGVYTVVVTYTPVEEGGDAAYDEVSDDFLLWVMTAEAPLAGGLGLGLLAGACALAGAVSIRRKK